MIRIEAKKGIRTAIGRLGENEARVVLFPVKDILDAFPGASFTMLNRRPGDAQAYPVNGQYVSVEGGELLWTVQSGDLAVQGFGECEIRAELGGAVVKTVIYQTEILRALDGAGTPPEPWESWVEDVTDAADRAEAAAALLENPGAEAETLTAGSSATASYADGVFHFGIPRGQKGNPGNPGDPGQPGQDGVSPTVAVEAITGGHQVTITDAEGDHTFDVMDGEQGDPGSPGQPGQDGYSPSASVTKSGSTATISITDKNGTTTAQVSDGDPTQMIDDTAGAGVTNKVWSADKTSELKSAINSKQDAPASAGTDGQFFGLLLVDGTLVPVWSDLPVGTNSTLGVMKVNQYGGLQVTAEGALGINSASDTVVKGGSVNNYPSTPGRQHLAVFYGLSKVAGVDLANEIVTLGQYPENSKSAISEMLNAPVSVSGSTPSINAKSGVRYVCGEVATLTIVAPASGCIDVVFESGATATVLTVTPPTGVTMKWANGFDPSSLDANTTYEINILDGEFGVVGKWT